MKKKNLLPFITTITLLGLTPTNLVSADDKQVDQFHTPDRHISCHISAGNDPLIDCIVLGNKIPEKDFNNISEKWYHNETTGNLDTYRIKVENGDNADAKITITNTDEPVNNSNYRIGLTEQVTNSHKVFCKQTLDYNMLICMDSNSLSGIIISTKALILVYVTGHYYIKKPVSGE